VAVTLALLAAVVYGAADFCGGLATRRASSESVVFCSQLAGIVLLVPVLPLLGGTPAPPDFGWGAVAGIGGGLGVLLLYRALSIGRMGVVSPITAVIAAVIPVVVSLAGGARPAVLADIGIVLAIIAVVLVSATPEVDANAKRAVGVPTAIGSGMAIGVFLVLLARSSPHAGLYPLLGARCSSMLVVAVAAMVGKHALMPPRSSAGIVLVAGGLDMAANALYVLAAQRGLLAIVATLTSLYPVSTIVLAAFVLRERLHRTQWAGAFAALGGVVLISR